MCKNFIRRLPNMQQVKNNKLKTKIKVLVKHKHSSFITNNEDFNNWAFKWLNTYKKPNVKEHTYKWTYETNVKNYLVPYFGNTKLSDIKQINIQEYFNLHKNLSMVTLKRQLNILSNIFDEAIFNDLCTKNPVRNINIVSNKKEFITRAYNKFQAETIQNNCSPYVPVQAAIFIILSTGLRRGEVLGLLWEDIDIKNRIIHVRRSLAQGDVNVPAIGSVKTKNSMRDIPITSDALINFLRLIPKSSQFVINGNGCVGFLPVKTFDTEYVSFIKTVCKKLGIPRLTPHELRHTYGTVLREKGLDLLSISKLLGHSDTKITEKHYIVNDIDVLRQRLEDIG